MCGVVLCWEEKVSIWRKKWEGERKNENRTNVRAHMEENESGFTLTFAMPILLFSLETGLFLFWILKLSFEHRFYKMPYYEVRIISNLDGCIINVRADCNFRSIGVLRYGTKRAVRWYQCDVIWLSRRKSYRVRTATATRLVRYGKM